MKGSNGPVAGHRHQQINYKSTKANKKNNEYDQIGKESGVPREIKILPENQGNNSNYVYESEIEGRHSEG